VLVGHAVRADQPQRFVGAQAVRFDTLQHGLLVVIGQGRERSRQGWPDATPGKTILRLWRQFGAEADPAFDPTRLVAQKSRHLPLTPALLAHQRADHPGLIQRSRRAARRVRGQQQPLVLRRTRGRLHDDRDNLIAPLSPIR
jgi:hypothetical protein